MVKTILQSHESRLNLGVQGRSNGWSGYGGEDYGSGCGRREWVWARAFECANLLLGVFSPLKWLQLLWNRVLGDALWIMARVPS